MRKNKEAENSCLVYGNPYSTVQSQKREREFCVDHKCYNAEAIAAGIPVIAVPLFADQPRNAKLAESHGFGVVIQKNSLDVNTITDAINQILTDQSYSRNIKRLSQMLKKKPVSVSHLLISWTEFVAEFKTLDNLVPAGNKLNFIQYYSLDVIGFLSLTSLLILYVIWKLLKILVLKICSKFFNERKRKFD
ncbi:unnamed protein product [Strongylus vulgaris]|uniref:glucuronosyltransferase n=1 Tax=Strongylus vulgaris TaxID=40348 RepID=A0A3P7J325_STRVU|nr:unnamed protein product [Strongylus vulgaris]